MFLKQESNEQKTESRGFSLVKRILIAIVLICLGVIMIVAEYLAGDKKAAGKSLIAEQTPQVLVTPKISDSKFYWIQEINKKNKDIINKVFVTDGYIVDRYVCSPCPEDFYCPNQCMGTESHITISEGPNYGEKLIIFTSSYDEFELEKKYKFYVKAADDKSSINRLPYNIKLIESKIIKDDEFFYKIKFSLNPGISEPKPYNFGKNSESSHIGNYLIDILQIAKPVSYDSWANFISSVHYDLKQGYSDFNKEYLVLFESNINAIDTQKIYKTNEFSVVVSEADSALLPFIKDSSYCEKDADCSVNNYLCSYGSFNKFGQYVEGYGCESIFYPQEEKNSEELKAMCPNISEYFEVNYEIKYDGSKCVNNKCMAQNRQVKCSP